MPRWATSASPSPIGQPQVLAPPLGGLQRATGQPGRQVVGAGDVPAYGPRVQHADLPDGATGDVRGQPTSDDLDLGELGHSQPSVLGQLGMPVR